MAAGYIVMMEIVFIIFCHWNFQAYWAMMWTSQDCHMVGKMNHPVESRVVGVAAGYWACQQGSGCGSKFLLVSCKLCS